MDVGLHSLLTAITPTILDVLHIFRGRKKVRLGVNENPGEICPYEYRKFVFTCRSILVSSYSWCIKTHGVRQHKVNISEHSYTNQWKNGPCCVCRNRPIARHMAIVDLRRNRHVVDVDGRVCTATYTRRRRLQQPTVTDCKRSAKAVAPKEAYLGRRRHSGLRLRRWKKTRTRPRSSSHAHCSHLGPRTHRHAHIYTRTYTRRQAVTVEDRLCTRSSWSVRTFLLYVRVHVLKCAYLHHLYGR